MVFVHSISINLWHLIFNLECPIFIIIIARLIINQMAAQPYRQLRDPFSLECCLPSRGEPYIGVDPSCCLNAIFCIQHSCHKNAEGLMHQMMPLIQFKRKIDQKKFMMEKKIGALVQNFSDFMDKLINQIREIKLRKCLQLSMLWLRDLSDNQQQYELMKKVYRTDLQGISCKQIHQLYFKIIYNEQLFKKQVNQIDCYKGITKILNQLTNKKQATKMLAQKITQIQGVLTNGQILKRLLPDKKMKMQNIKQVLLEEGSQQKNYQINYNRARLIKSSTNYRCLFSKYPMNPHVTYHLSIKTKYSNIMIGICEQKAKQEGDHIDLHHNSKAILYNCANGNTYKDGMFVSGSNAGIQNLKQLNLKLRFTSSQFFIMNKAQVLVRSNKTNLQGSLYFLFQSRTQQDSVQIFCDSEISTDIKMDSMIMKQQKHSMATIQQEMCDSPKMYQAMAKEDYQYLIKSNQNIGKIQQEQFQPKQDNNYNIQELPMPSKLNQKITKIKSKFKQFKGLQANEQQKNVKNKNQEQQKNKYINEMKQKIRLQMLKGSSAKVNVKQGKYNKIVNNKNEEYKNESEVQVKMSASDGSDINSVTRLTKQSMANKIDMLSKLRRGSENMQIKSDDIFVNKIGQMAQSISPQHI